MDGITESVYISLSKAWEMVKGREAWRRAVHGVEKSQDREAEQQNKPILSTAQRLQDLAHLNSPVTAVNRPLGLTYLGAHSSSTGMVQRVGRPMLPTRANAVSYPHPLSSPHEAGGGPQFYPWTWVPGMGQPTKSQGLF